MFRLMQHTATIFTGSEMDCIAHLLALSGDAKVVDLIRAGYRIARV